MSRTLRDNVHRCNQTGNWPHYANGGTLFECDCGKLWWCKPWGGRYTLGDWIEISPERFAELTGEVVPAKLESQQRPNTPGIRAWWRRTFKVNPDLPYVKPKRKR